MLQKHTTTRSGFDIDFVSICHSLWFSRVNLNEWHHYKWLAVACNPLIVCRKIKHHLEPAILLHSWGVVLNYDLPFSGRMAYFRCCWWGGSRGNQPERATPEAKEWRLGKGFGDLSHLSDLSLFILIQCLPFSGFHSCIPQDHLCSCRHKHHSLPSCIHFFMGFFSVLRPGWCRVQATCFVCY